MKIIDVCGIEKYSPLIPAVCAICKAKAGEKIQIVTDNKEVFKDLKEYLSEQNIGFREIYDEDRMTLQFTISHE
ncbi:sulfurtransferase TusA family protein [Bacteroides sp. 224]|uniref:sulfurtransferase TusA family protein n=1 Tax=Bacteroides sp. 224 TaxID=2302936 RepID=UPI0013D50ED6|nr:sulfurtransferase TusA family protein [Bacteroides sp. 224]NDV64379.1 sulfurtransferase TusA family protein [Bacteroides sp. 224]